MVSFARAAGKFLVQVMASVILIMGVSIVAKGMYLIGVPKIEQVEYVAVEYPALSKEPKIFRDQRSIESAVNLTGFLRYRLLQKPDAGEEPAITMTYFLANGKSCTVSANHTTVWWQGKAHVIQDDEIFMNLAEGIFFLPEVMERK